MIGDVDREAKRLQKAALKLEKQLTTRGWTDTVFVEWSSLTERSDTLRQQAARLRFWGDCLQDSVEIVDLRSGEIRDFAINAWMLNETLAGLRQLDHPRIQTLTDKLVAQAPDLLTFLNAMTQPLAD